MRLILAAALVSMLCLPGAASAQPATRADPPRPHSLELREEDRLLDERRRKARESEAKKRGQPQGGKAEAAPPNLSSSYAKERSAH